MGGSSEAGRIYLPKPLMPRQLYDQKNSAVLEHPIEQAIEHLNLFFAEPAKELRLDGFLRGKQLRIERSARSGKLEIRCAPILGIRLAAGTTFFLPAPVS